MPGGRRTHDYPDGKPLPLVLVHLAIVITGLCWIRFVTSGWLPGIGLTLIIIALGAILSRLNRAYGINGQAVPVPRQQTTIVFPDGKPAPLRMLRYAAVAMVLALVALGISPIPYAIVKGLLIGTALVLFALVFAHFAFLGHYVNTGRAKEVTTTDEKSA